MANEIAQAFVRIRPNMQGFQSETESGVKKAFSSVAKIAGVALGTGEAIKFTKEIVSSAAQVQKSTEAIRAGFGSAADSVLNFTDKTGKGLGISAAAGQETAAKFAILFHNMGIGETQSAGMTIGFEKLAGSLGAIKGVDPSEIMAKLSTAAAGNTRGLKSLGIVIDQNAIKQEALRLGLLHTAAASDTSRIADERVAIAKAKLAEAERKYGQGTTQVASAQIALQQAQSKANAEQGKIVGTLTPAAKAQVIYALATKDLANLQGQASKHSGDLINVQRRLSAEWSNAKDELGAKLLPIVTRVVTAFADHLPGAFELARKAGKAVADFIRDHVAGPFETLRDRVAELGDVLVHKLRDPFNDVKDEAARVGEKLAGMVPSLDSVKDAAHAIAEAMKTAINFTVQYQNILLPLGGALGSITLAMEAWTIATEVWSGVTAIATAIQEAFNLSMDANPIGIVILAIAGLIGALVVLYQRSQTVRDIVNGVWNAMRDSAVAVWGAIRDYVVAAMKVIRDVIVTGWNIIRVIVTTAWALIKNDITTVLNVIRDVINIFLDVIHGNWGKVWQDIKRLVADVLNGIVNHFRIWWSGFTGIFSAYTDGLKRIFGDMWAAVEDAFTSAGKWLEEKAITIVLKLIEPFSHLPKWLGGGWAQDMKSNLTTALDGLKAPAADSGSAVGTTFGTNLGNSANAAVATAVEAMKMQLSGALTSLIPAGATPHGNAGDAGAAAKGGGRYTTQQIYQLLVGAGFSPNDAANFVGIAGAESGGRYGALNNTPSTGDYSVGLFQENFFKGLGPARTARYAPQFGLSPNMGVKAFVAWLAQHPAAQAKIAYDMFSSSGYSPWQGDAFVKAHPELLSGGGGGGGGAGVPSPLTVGTTAPKAQSLASTKQSLSDTYKTIAAHAKELGSALTAQIKAQMAEARAAIANVSNTSTAQKAREELKHLGTVVSTALKDLKTELALEKTFDGLKKAAAKLGAEVSPEVKKHMAEIRDEIGKATTPEQLAALHKQMDQVKDEIAAQLAIIKGRIALSNTFAGLKDQAAKLHDEITPALQAEMKDIQDRIATVSTAASRSKLKAEMARVKAEITAQLAAIKKTIADEKSAFASAFSELMSGADRAFDQATQKALRQMQVTVTGAFSAFTFGGSIVKTPAEIALQQLTDAHDAAAEQAKLAADQAQLAADQASGDQAAILVSAQAVADDLYGIHVKALQAQATIERDAANAQLGDAQTAYQAQRDLLKQQMDQRAALIEQGMENGSIAAADGMAQLTAIFNDPKYGLDLQNSGLIIGGNLYDGLAKGLAPVFELLKKLQDEMRKAGIPVGADTIPNSSGPPDDPRRGGGATTPGAATVPSSGSPGARDDAAAAGSSVGAQIAKGNSRILEELAKQTAIAAAALAKQNGDPSAASQSQAAIALAARR